MADDLNDPALAAIHERVLKMSSSHRKFALPVLRAIDRLGGSGKKKDVVAELRNVLGAQVAPELFDELGKRGRWGWARFELRTIGLIGGPEGTWALTDLGKRYVASQANVAIVIPPIALEPASSSIDTATKTVPVTGFRGYEIPALEALASGKVKTKDIIDEIGRRLEKDLLAGDRGRMPGGSTVWRFRANWAVSTLGKAGFAQNAQKGTWQITDAGKQRLAQERAAWKLSDEQGEATASIVDAEAVPAHSEADPDAQPVPTFDARWEALRKTLGGELVDELEARIHPALGPSPSQSIARNVILYGPPGTGKTHIAKLVARALTGDQDGGDDGLFRLVQFHPSYAYEDFIQGLKPDLTKTELRYSLQRGPFLKICDDARADPSSFYVLVIDEINRGDPARIFGELLYALEYRDERVTLALAGDLSVPSNVVIIGTMNSVDRSVALVDYALRRRFGFIRIEPDGDIVSDTHGDTLLGNAGAVVLDKMNAWLTLRLDREHVLGHSFFLASTLAKEDKRSFDRIWSLDVRPLLEEYFFGDAESLNEANAHWKACVGDAIKMAAEVEADEQ